MIKWNRMNPSASSLKLCDDVTFREFLAYIISSGRKWNEHCIPQYKICNPCRFDFTFIGRLDNLTLDKQHVLRSIFNEKQYKLPEVHVHQKNRKTPSPYASMYSDIPEKLMKKIYNTYNLDFELFGYDKDIDF